jgi:hypothetical protein
MGLSTSDIAASRNGVTALNRIQVEEEIMQTMRHTGTEVTGFP